jgi:hypothetical protein
MIISRQILFAAAIGPGQAWVVRVDLYPVFVLFIVVSAARHCAEGVAVGSVVGFVGAFARAAVAGEAACAADYALDQRFDCGEAGGDDSDGEFDAGN